MHSYKQGFTLVELIVVIVILGVLSTIGFVSYNGYLGGARDSNRISALKGINDSLNLYQTKNDLPLPENYVTVTASGTILGYQGYVGQNILEIINYTNGGQDPKDDSYYTYYLTNDRKNFQLLGFLEEAENLQAHLPRLIDQAQAADYTNRFPKVFGKKLGILTLAITNSPIQDLSLTNNTLDIVNTPDVYTAYFTDQDSITGAGANIFSSIALKTNSFLEDDPDLLGYWILEDNNSIGNGKDISSAGNTLTSSGVLFQSEKAVFEKARHTTLTGTPITLGSDFTIIGKVKPTASGSRTACWGRNIITQSPNGGCNNTAWSIYYAYHSYSSAYDQHLAFSYGDASSWPTIYSTKQYFIGSEIFFILVKQGSSASLYVNGLLDKQFTVTNMQDNNFPLVVGGNSGDFFEGEMYKFLIYKKAFSEDEVNFTFNNL